MSSADQCSIAAILVIAGCIHGASLSLPFTQIWDLVDYKRSKLNNTLVSLIVIEWLWLCCTVGLEAFTCSSNLIGTGVMISNRAQYLNNFISPAVLASVSIIQCSRLVVLRVSESIQKICYISTGILLIGNWIFFNWMSAFSLNGAQGNFVIIESLLNLFFFSLSIQVLIIDLLITQKLRQLLVQGEIAINPRQRTIIVRQLVLTLTPALVTVADIIVWAYFSYDKDGFKYSPIGNALDGLLNMSTLLSAFHLCCHAKYYTTAGYKSSQIGSKAEGALVLKRMDDTKSNSKLQAKNVNRSATSSKFVDLPDAEAMRKSYETLNVGAV